MTPDDFPPGSRRRWLARHVARYRAKFGIEGPPEPVPPGDAGRPPRRRALLVLVRLDRCEHLLGREEYRHGCGGMRCRHGCDLGHPAMPAGLCQACPDYSPLDGEGWLS